MLSLKLQLVIAVALLSVAEAGLHDLNGAGLNGLHEGLHGLNVPRPSRAKRALMYFRPGKSIIAGIAEPCETAAACDFYAECEDGKCVCPTFCLPEYDPVCGSDDITYQNTCELGVRSCQDQVDLYVVHVGVCEGATCPDGSAPVNCDPDPCDVETCDALPRFLCEADYCGDCSAIFYDMDGNVIDCDNPCNLPAEAGPCNENQSRWYYSVKSGVCEEFVYGGCEGNANNFENEADCCNECSPELGDVNALGG